MSASQPTTKKANTYHLPPDSTICGAKRNSKSRTLSSSWRRGLYARTWPGSHERTKCGGETLDPWSWRGGGTAPRRQLPSGSGMDVVTRHSPLATHYDSCHRTISVADAVVPLWRLTNPILQSMLPIGVRANLGHPKASPFSNDTNGSEGPARQDGGK